MKKQILILAVLVLSGVAAVAQQRPDNRRFDNRGDYCGAVCHRFSEACSLSDDDAAKFKEIYEAYYSELQSIREQYRPQRRSGMSDEDGAEGKVLRQVQGSAYSASDREAL